MASMLVELRSSQHKDPIINPLLEPREESVGQRNKHSLFGNTEGLHCDPRHHSEHHEVRVNLRDLAII